jgi:hypothetical protein
MDVRSEWEKLGQQPDELILSFSNAKKDMEVTLSHGAAYIGRYPHLRLCVDRTDVSHIHARIDLDTKTKKWKIKDLNSSNGTKVNGRKVRSDRATALKSGDTIELSGEVCMKVQVRSRTTFSHC